MLRFIDISNHQEDLPLGAILPSVDAVVCKATGGNGFVDGLCDGFMQAAMAAGKPVGFYHFAHDGGSAASASAEARFFIDNCLGYFGKGIPILDWETDTVDAAWVNEFVRTVHGEKGVWPWIYANPWRFDQGDVEGNCMRWVASYPAVSHPTFEQAASWSCPSADGFVGAWQFCSDGRIDGYSGDLDCNLFYGSEDAWAAYAATERDGNSIMVLENDRYKVTIEEK